MGIFKESLDSYIRKQFEARQEVLAIPENRSGVMGGAFHKFTTNKYCNFRMASCVDITGDELLDLDLKVGNVQLEAEYRGPGLARSYILQGGQLLNPKGARTPAMRRGFPGGGRPLGGAYGDPLARANAKDGYGLVPMPGITKFNVRTKSAYGSLREAKVDFVCHNLRQLAVLELLYMRPGYPILCEWGWNPYIYKDKDGKIKSDQFTRWVSDLEVFWGQTYRGNFKPAASQTAIYDLIHTRRELSQGNYDAILGLCKNFSYSARPDGGFNCTTELMAVGEVLSSLKGEIVTYNTTEYVNAGKGGLNADDVMAVSKKIHIPRLLDFLQKTHDFKYNMNSDDVFGEDGNWFYRAKESRVSVTQGDDGVFGTEDDVYEVGKYANKSSAYLNPVSITGNGALNFYDERVNVYNIQRADLEEQYRKEYLESNVPDPFDDKAIIKDNVHIMNFKEGRTGWQDFLVGAVAVSGAAGAAATGGLTVLLSVQAAILLKKFQNDNLGCTEAYIRLDALCYILNKYVINPINKNIDPSQNQERINSFQTLNYNPYTKKYAMNPYKEYEEDLMNLMQNALSFAPGLQAMNGLADMSTDPFVCLMPKQVSGIPEGETDENIGVPPVANNFGFRPDHFVPNREFVNSFPKDDEETKKKAKGSIGHIHLNIKYLLKVHDGIYGEAGKENPDYSVGKFMQKVIDGINKVMAGNIKLGLTTDNNQPGITSIVDLNMQPQTKYSDIFKFNVLSNDTAVRSFSFNSAVPSAMASTIAIGAGDPDNADSLDAVTFAAMNRGLKNRLYQKQLGPSGELELTAEEQDELFKGKKLQLENELKEIGDICNNLMEYQAMILSGQIFQDSGEETRNKKGNIATQVSRLTSLLNTVSMKDRNGFIVNDKSKNPPASTPIPIKLDMTFDGIAGLTMGQLFRVDESRLPQAYRRKNVIFVVVAEDQSVDENGNWITKISGQMQLFPGDVDPNDALEGQGPPPGFDAKSYADRFYEACKGGGTDDAELDRLFIELTDEELAAVDRYWSLDPEQRTKNKSLLHWIDKEIVGENHKKYKRWRERGGVGKPGDANYFPPILTRRPA